MSKASPRVTVGVPVFNGERFLAEALDALLNQTYSDFEIVISDNASTDRTEDICRAYAARDSRVRYFRSDLNRGAAWNHNRVFELAKGEFFKWNSADDVCAPEFLARCVAALDRDPGAVMACSQIVEIDGEGKRLHTPSVPGSLTPQDSFAASAHVRFREKIRYSHMCLTIFSLFRSEILRRTSLIGSYSDSDRVLLAHLALFGHVVAVPEVLYFNRDHAGRFTRAFDGSNQGPQRDWQQLAHDRMVWFDPSYANRKVFPYCREFIELWRVVARSPLRWPERLGCYGTLLGWAREHRKDLCGDFSYYPRKWLGRRFPKLKAAWRSFDAKRSAENRMHGAEAGKELSAPGSAADQLNH